MRVGRGEEKIQGEYGMNKGEDLLNHTVGALLFITTRGLGTVCHELCQSLAGASSETQAAWWYTYPYGKTVMTK